MRQESSRLSGSPPRDRSHRTTRGKCGSKRAALWLIVVCALLPAACSGDDPPPPDTGDPPSQTAVAPDPAPADPSAAQSTGQPNAQADAPAADASARRAPATPAPPPPVSAHILLERAAQLEHDGFWEAAAEARAQALGDASAATLSPGDLGDAYLAQIRLLLELEAPGRAESTLAALDASGAPVTTAQRWLIRARVLAAIGRAEPAVAAYHAYLDAGGGARHHALLERARLRAAIGDTEFALRDYESIRDDPATPALDLESALLEGGLLLENAGRYAEADEWYRALGEVSPWVSDDAFALHRSGAVRLQQDDMPGVREAWTQLLIDHPGHWRAIKAYDGLIAEGIAVDPLVAGLYFYRQSRFDDATAVYAALLDGDPTAAETGVALYYLAAIDEDLGAGADAIEGYLASVAADPDGPQADNALWWAGRLLEEQESNTLARVVFARLADGYPDSEFAIEAGFRVPLTRYRAGALAAAADDFRALTTRADPAQAQRAWLWLGKSLDALGDAAGAASALAAAQSLGQSTGQGGAPHDYAALRAQALAAGALDTPRLIPGPVTPQDPPAASPLDAWVNALPGADAATADAIEARRIGAPPSICGPSGSRAGRAPLPAGPGADREPLGGRPRRPRLRRDGRRASTPGGRRQPAPARPGGGSPRRPDRDLALGVPARLAGSGRDGGAQLRGR